MKRILLSALFAAAVAAPASLIAADASESWTGHCAKCHGPDGTGKTKMGAKLKIRDLTDKAVQAEFTDEQAFENIKNGIKDEKGAKLIMNAFAEKLSDEEITGMVAYVRGLCSK